MEHVGSISPGAGPAPEWGDDPLSRFLVAAHANARDAFELEVERYGALVEVDALYRELIEKLGGSPQQMTSSLLRRAHGLFLAAASLALSGLVAEAYTLLNRSLKTALQGVFVAADPKRQQLWLNRNNDDASRQLMQDEFNASDMRRHFRQTDSATAAICEKLLRRTVEHSSHPNAYAAPNRNTTEEHARLDVAQQYFVVGDEVQRYCLRSAAQVGICCLSMFFYAFPDQYRESGIPDRLTKLRQGH